MQVDNFFRFSLQASPLKLHSYRTNLSISKFQNFLSFRCNFSPTKQNLKLDTSTKKKSVFVDSSVFVSCAFTATKESTPKDSQKRKAYIVEKLIDHLLELLGPSVLGKVHGSSQRRSLWVRQKTHHFVGRRFSLLFFHLHCCYASIRMCASN